MPVCVFVLDFGRLGYGQRNGEFSYASMASIPVPIWFEECGLPAWNHSASNIDQVRRHANTVLGFDAKSLILKIAHGGVVPDCQGPHFSVVTCIIPGK